ncbi:hypothetical protein ACFVJI_29540 [Streptomyces sp. NPDC127584]|uniref:hypothetical protein n=1 Tax=Streptomyces sp. NPDC127584 TaxID=3345403 RepID=UPI00364041AA
MEVLTEYRPVNGPVVYGFLRLVGVSAHIEATGARLLLARRTRIGPVHVSRHQTAHRRFPAPLLLLSTES